MSEPLLGDIRIAAIDLRELTMPLVSKEYVRSAEREDF